MKTSLLRAPKKIPALKKGEVLLPNTLSGLIQVSVRDLLKCHRQSKIYKINMHSWHQPNSHCSVCQAGAVMAQSFHASPKKSFYPHSFTQGNKLAAINSIRVLSIRSALMDLLEHHTYDIPTEIYDAAQAALCRFRRVAPKSYKYLKINGYSDDFNVPRYCRALLSWARILKEHRL